MLSVQVTRTCALTMHNAVLRNKLQKVVWDLNPLGEVLPYTPLKAGFHQRQSRNRSRSRSCKRAYDQ